MHFFLPAFHEYIRSVYFFPQYLITLLVMNNELFFLAITILDLCIVLLAWRLGKEWLIATILANIILTSTFVAKLIPIFGYVAPSAAAFYASIFVATDILTEHHGKKEGYKSIWLGFLALLTFTIMGQLVLQLEPIADREIVSSAMHTLFSAIPRIAIASFVAYVIAQSFDIWFFHFLREKTGSKWLWFRNNVSTIFSQLVDSIVFFPLAFFGTLPNSTLIELMIIGWLLRVPIALIDTPFLYLSYIVRGQSPPDFGKKKSVEIPGTAM